MTEHSRLCTHTEAVSEQDIERGHERSTRWVAVGVNHSSLPGLQERFPAKVPRGGPRISVPHHSTRKLGRRRLTLHHAIVRKLNGCTNQRYEAS